MTNPTATRPTTPKEEAIIRIMVPAYRAKLRAMTNAEVTALAFAALMTLAERDGPAAAAAWAKLQADRLCLAECEGSA